jgi:hypothetical protein
MNAAQIRSAYARNLSETIGVRRYTGAGSARPRFDVYVRGKATPYAAHELIGTITQGDTKVFLLVQDIITGQMALPITTNDKVVVKGRELAIINPAERKAPDGTLIAYEIQARGP